MDKPIIEVKNLGKQYRLGQSSERYTALRDVIMNVVRNPFSFAKDKAKTIAGLKEKKEFWALKNVSFSINRGEVIGVIGANGAGKSTLLKILTGITPPTEGEAILRGRVSSLLEVGTGFHPELTGRENVYLNGAILGMSKKEMDAKFDEIVEFAGIEQFLDTPVKRYSSGMYVRLAFSVAAHLEPDILLVDEVLAVGDAEFQKKCLGKMEEVTSKAGRTILFVSHNMGAIEQLCERTILIEKGRVKMFGKTSDVVQTYLTEASKKTSENISDRKDRRGTQGLKMTNCYFKNESGQPAYHVTSGEKTTLVFEYECRSGESFKDIVIGANVSTVNGEGIFLCHSKMTAKDFGTVQGSGTFECTIDKMPLVPGNYSMNIRIESAGIVLDDMANIISFETLSGDFFGTGTSIKHSLVYTDHSWK